MYRKLKALMFENDIDQRIICKKFKRSQGYITARMMGRASWNMDEVYAMCDLLNISNEQIPIYFPRGGKA